MNRRNFIKLSALSVAALKAIGIREIVPANPNLARCATGLSLPRVSPEWIELMHDFEEIRDCNGMVAAIVSSGARIRFETARAFNIGDAIEIECEYGPARRGTLQGTVFNIEKESNQPFVVSARVFPYL